MRSGTFTPQLKLVAAFVVLIAALALFVYRQPFLVERVQENVMSSLDPSPERLFLYGARHFDITIPQEYDLDRAKHFFALTIEKDPQFPMANYQLARIEFLRSNFPRALFLIDQEFKNNPEPAPASYYLRGLIKGYMGEYAEAAKDYEAYFKIRPATWAGINDYSWILLKADLPEGAHEALSWGLKQWPENAWLLTNDATALYELGRYEEAATRAMKAIPAVKALTREDWLNAYPGNDPLIAQEGLDNFKKTTEENLQKILAKAK